MRRGPGGLNLHDERMQIAQRCEARKAKNDGYATKRLVSTDSQALCTEEPIVVLFYWLACPYSRKYKEFWNSVADEHNAQGKRCPVPMIAVKKEVMVDIVRSIDGPGCVGGYVKEFPTVRILQHGKLVKELANPCRPEEGINPTTRLRMLVQEACEMVEFTDPGFRPPYP